MADKWPKSATMTDSPMPSRDNLLQSFQQHPGRWLALADLRPAFDVPERTLRRWLADAVQRGELLARGRNKGRQYGLPATSYYVPTKVTEESAAYPLLFSQRSRDIIERMRAPLFTRQPCSYREDWLLAYQPNRSAYLQPEQRQRLHDRGRRTSEEMPAGTYARKIYNRLLVDLSYNSSRLEGNTYSLADTEKLLLEGVAAQGKLDAEKVMILNHLEAIRFLVDGIHRLRVDNDNIRSLHYLLADGLVAPGMAGQLRDEGVRISATTYMPLEGRARLERLLDQITSTAARILDPFEQSLFLLAHIAYLQGFIDVNKRTSRMAANIPLVRHNLVPLSFNDIDKEDYASAIIAVYELNDIGPLAELYTWSYLRSCERYGAAAEAVGIDSLRVLHRQRRRELIARIVREGRHGEVIEALLAESAAGLPEEQRAKFAEDTHSDLANLSAFSIAGMGLTREELEHWQAERG